MSKQFLGVIVIIVLLFVGIFALSGDKSKTASSKSSNSAALTQHVIGQGTTGVTLVEYGDYQCPYCGQYYPVVKQVQTEYNDKIFFQFRNFPLVNLHQNAFAAARAAEAAGMQNKYWEMHDALYESQDQWSQSGDAVAFFNQIAQQLGLNVTKFKSDYGSSKVNDAINADSAEGTKLGVEGTPTFFIDGKKVTIGQSVDAFKKVLDAEIAKKTPASSTGTSTSTGQ